MTITFTSRFCSVVCSSKWNFKISSWNVNGIRAWLVIMCPQSGSTLTTGLLLCKTAIRLISGRLSPLWTWQLTNNVIPFGSSNVGTYPYLACHVTKTKKGLKVRQNMPDIVDTALLVLNQCSLQCYRWIFQTSAYFGNCCITRGRCDTFS